MRDQKPDTKFHFTPTHVLLLGGGILGSGKAFPAHYCCLLAWSLAAIPSWSLFHAGVLLTASVSYRQAGKQYASVVSGSIVAIVVAMAAAAAAASAIAAMHAYQMPVGTTHGSAYEENTCMPPPNNCAAVLLQAGC